VYRDTVEALQAVARHYDAGNIGGALTVLIPPGRAEEVRSALRPLSVTPVEMLPKQVPRQEVELDAFDWDTVFSHPMIDRAVQMGSVSPDLIVRALAGEEVEWNPVAQDLAKQAWLGELAEEDPYQAATIALDRSLRAATTHSVLTQLTLHAEGGRVHLIPYHGGGLHEALGAGDQAVLLRPARVNRRYWATFDAAIAKLEALLNKRGVKEREIEAVLEENPLFLNSLGFERIYHQVILPRNGASDLKPDVVAEPADSEWAEILDLKLPTTSVLVGPPNRAAMSAALTEDQMLPPEAHRDHRARPDPLHRGGAAPSAHSPSRPPCGDIRRPSHGGPNAATSVTRPPRGSNRRASSYDYRYGRQAVARREPPAAARLSRWRIVSRHTPP
jgi:hypothetical protein